MKLSYNIKVSTFMPFGALLPLAATGYGIYAIAQARAFMSVGTWIYESAEWLGPLAFILMLAIGWLMDHLKRPFTHVPLDGAWWEFFVFGLFATLAGLFLIASILTVLLLFTILIPIKAIIVYTLGANATIASALIAIPLAYFGVGIAFTLIYLLLLLNGRGNMVRDNQNLFPTNHSTGWMPAAWDTLHFSLATMLGADTAGVSPSGVVRWLTLTQSLVAKALEIVIVGVGVTLILNRLP